MIVRDKDSLIAMSCKHADRVFVLLRRVCGTKSLSAMACMYIRVLSQARYLPVFVCIVRKVYVLQFGSLYRVSRRLFPTHSFYTFTIDKKGLQDEDQCN